MHLHVICTRSIKIMACNMSYMHVLDTWCAQWWCPPPQLQQKSHHSGGGSSVLQPSQATSLLSADSTWMVVWWIEYLFLSIWDARERTSWKRDSTAAVEVGPSEVDPSSANPDLPLHATSALQTSVMPTSSTLPLAVPEDSRASSSLVLPSSSKSNSRFWLPPVWLGTGDSLIEASPWPLWGTSAHRWGLD